MTAQANTSTRSPAFYQYQHAKQHERPRTRSRSDLLQRLGRRSSGRAAAVGLDQPPDDLDFRRRTTTRAATSLTRDRAAPGPQIDDPSGGAALARRPDGQRHPRDGRQRSVGRRSRRRRMMIFRGDLTYFKEGWGGSHEFKTGFWARAAADARPDDLYSNDGFVLEEHRQIDPNNPAAGTGRLPPAVPVADHGADAVDPRSRRRVLRPGLVEAESAHHRQPTACASISSSGTTRSSTSIARTRRRSGRAPASRTLVTERREERAARQLRPALRADQRPRLHHDLRRRPAARIDAHRQVPTPTATASSKSPSSTPAATAELSGIEFNKNLHNPFADEFIVGFAQAVPRTRRPRRRRHAALHARRLHADRHQRQLPVGTEPAVRRLRPRRSEPRPDSPGEQPHLGVGRA